MFSIESIIKGFLKNHKSILIAIFILGICNSFFLILIPICIGKFYEVVFQINSNRVRLLEYINLNISGDIVILFISFLLLILVRHGSMYFTEYYTGILGEKFSKEIREKLFSHHLSISLPDHNKKYQGKYLLRYSGDQSAVRIFVVEGIVMFIFDAFNGIFLILALIYLQLQLGLLVLFSFVCCFFVMFFLTKKYKEIIQERRDIRSSMLAFITSSLFAFTTIKAFNKDTTEKGKFMKRSLKQYKVGVIYQRNLSIVKSLSLFLLNGMILLILTYIYYSNKRIDLANNSFTFISFIILFISFSPVLRRLLRVSYTWHAGIISFHKILKIMNLSPEDENQENIQKLPKIGKVEFRNVSFSYDSKPLIENLSFSISSGSLVRITGPDSSGKSTLFRLLSGLYKSISGEIRMDNLDIKNISKRELRRHVALIAKDVPLIGNTIFQSISYSRNKANKANAVDILQDLKFIQREDNIDLKINNGGFNLSSQEEDLLLVARALLTKKEIILLDNVMGGFSTVVKSNLVDLINKMKVNHIIIFVDENPPADLKIDYTIQLNNYIK